jgi:hypothetical protein
MSPISMTCIGPAARGFFAPEQTAQRMTKFFFGLR